MLQSLIFMSAEAKETQIRDQTAKIASLEEACQDLEGTIVRFRELVVQLQTFVRLPSAQSFVLTRDPQGARCSSNRDPSRTARVRHGCITDRRDDVTQPEVAIERVQEPGSPHRPRGQAYRGARGTGAPQHHPTIPPAGVRRVGHGRDELLPVLPAPRSEAGPHQHSGGTEPQFTGVAEWRRVWRACRCLRGACAFSLIWALRLMGILDAGTSIEFVDDVQALRVDPPSVRRRVFPQYRTHIPRDRPHGEAHRHAHRPPPPRGVPRRRVCHRCRQVSSSPSFDV